MIARSPSSSPLGIVLDVNFDGPVRLLSDDGLV